MSVDSFHPAVRAWFAKNFSDPTEIQARAWPEISRNIPLLIAAPTGSGKTLAAFLAVLDDLLRRGLESPLPDAVDTIYVSPLKALTYDIQLNLEKPLQGIRQELEGLKLPPLGIRSLVRTGDSSSTERQALVKRPPQILVTTPESLYLLLTSAKGRAALSTARRVIVDEVHALAPGKRGSHLALSLERLDRLCGRPLVRIGLSATQKPMALVAEFLFGSGRQGKILDLGHKRALDLSLEIPGSPLEAVMSGETWTEVYDRLAQLVQAHKTTLIFVNTRRMAERLARQLAERLGEEAVTSHHGSLSRERRFEAEQRLKSGSLRALVATASLELGLDVGAVDLVCQIGSPRAISTFLQRVGRSGHRLSATPKGRLFPLTRDELVECAALLDAVSRGELDALTVPQAPLDILAQQIVAEASIRDCGADELYDLAKAAFPYRNLLRPVFDAVAQMLGEGFASRRGRSGAFLHLDGVHGRLRGRKGANLAALTSGGAIPDNADYDVILEPAGHRLGSVNEDFAIESMAGDIFQLGNRSWRILKVEQSKVRVEDAQGQPPTLPFWLGEAPGRSAELSQAVSRLRSSFLNEGRASLDRIPGVVPGAAAQITEYLEASKAALGGLPTQEEIILERFFDQVGDQHLVIHSPYGARFNRAWGLALRKRFCRTFNFELQAAAGEDAILISLGPTHSFGVQEPFGFLSSSSLRGVLVQALLAAPMFQVRWRWNANRSLAVPRWRGGRKNPPALQRMQAEDLLALVFPQQLACAENIAGDREVPDHPLVNQTISDCLTEAMDLERLESFIRDLEAGKITTRGMDLKEPSPLAAEILNARPYAFLDDAPLEERRSRAVVQGRALDGVKEAELGRLDPAAVEAVKAEAWPRAENEDEVHDALMLAGFISVSEAGESGWLEILSGLEKQGRALPCSGLWAATERKPELERALTGDGEALTEIVRSRLEVLGPVTAESLSLPLHGGGLGEGGSAISAALATLESQGFLLRMGEGRFCERRLLARIHRATLTGRRREIESVSAQDYMRFLFSWQNAAPDSRLDGPEGLARVLERLEGWSAPGLSWERDLLLLRMSSLEPGWLDNLCLSGRWQWVRPQTPEREVGAGRTAAFSRSTPISFVPRPVEGGEPTELPPAGLSSSASIAWKELRRRGASFFGDLIRAGGLLPTQTEEGLAELVAAGLVSSDCFQGLRALLARGGKSRALSFGAISKSRLSGAGRWSLIGPPAAESPEVRARLLLRRYGIVFKRVLEREENLPPWRDLLKIYWTLEARGEIRGGRFVDGFSGEQYALPEAVDLLRFLKRRGPEGHLISISACDPLNLAGIITPGDKVPAQRINRVLYRDGLPLASRLGRKSNLAPGLDPRSLWGRA